MQITRNANLLGSVCLMRYLPPRSRGLEGAGGAAASATTRLVSALDTEVVIPNRTKNRTHRRLFVAARHTHDLENHTLSRVPRLERKTDAVPVVCAAGRLRRRCQHRTRSCVEDLNLGRASSLEL